MARIGSHSHELKGLPGRMGFVRGEPIRLAPVRVLAPPKSAVCRWVLSVRFGPLGALVGMKPPRIALLPVAAHVLWRGGVREFRKLPEVRQLVVGAAQR
jgi:hypothetical protein